MLVSGFFSPSLSCIVTLCCMFHVRSACSSRWFSKRIIPVPQQTRVFHLPLLSKEACEENSSSWATEENKLKMWDTCKCTQMHGCSINIRNIWSQPRSLRCFEVQKAGEEGREIGLNSSSSLCCTDNYSAVFNRYSSGSRGQLLRTMDYQHRYSKWFKVVQVNSVLLGY